MNIFDTLADSLFQEFSSISVGQLMLALAIAFVLSLYIVLIYRLLYTGVLFSRRFALSLVLLAMITCVVILAISTNVVLSLGMVGALSIVRFRTAVKEVMDTVFMFWAIVIGIMTGAGFALITAIATLLIGILLLLLFYVWRRVNRGSYLVMLRLQTDTDIASLLQDMPAYRIKSRSTTEERQELVLEMKLGDAEMQRVQQLVAVPGVAELNVVAYNAQTTL